MPSTRLASGGEAPSTSSRPGSARGLDAVLAGAVGLLALALRAGPLGPDSLWLDDAWVALVHRAEGAGEIRLVGLTAPGFVVGLRLWFELVGFGETAAQLVPLAAGVVAPALAHLLARSLGWRRPAALLGALVLAASPVGVDYATRVKQYTVEVALGVGLLALGAHLLGDPRSARRWLAVLAGGTVATAVSTPLAAYVAAAVAAGLVRGVVGRDRSVLRLALGTGAAFAAAAALWYVAVVAPAVSGAALSSFWRDDFLVLDRGVGPALDSLAGAATGVAAGLSGLGAPAVVVAAVVLALAAVGRHRSDLAVLLATPTAVALVLAAAERAPLGGGRTDAWLHPTFALALAGGADRVVAALPRWWGRGAVVAACLVVVATAAPAAPYPAQDVRALVAALDERRDPGDAVLVYPATMWAYALYTGGDVALEPSGSSSWGFAPRFADDDTFVLPPGRADPSAYAPTVAELGRRFGHVWLVASHWREDHAALHRQLAAAGFEVTEVVAADGAELTGWRRRR